MKMHAIKLLSAVCFAAATAVSAHAVYIVAPPPPPPAGTYTYDFGLPNGASFTMTMTGAFGAPGSSNFSYNFSGTPDPAYAFALASVAGNTATPDDVFDYELALQYNSTTTGYSNILVYTFVEPLSFWELAGSPAFTTGDGESIYGLQGTSAFDFATDTYIQFFGTVDEGAYYAYYSDPPCTTCTVTTSFVPATPEPSSLALLSTGVAGMIGMYRRRRS